MAKYQFINIGKIVLPDTQTFSVQINFKEAENWEKSVYAFLVDDKIQRIGSSKGILIKRMKAWSRDVTNRLRSMNGVVANKSATPVKEAEEWLRLLELHGDGYVYAREATEVVTPVGRFNAYMDEESVLINRHKPPLNRHSNR